MEKLIKFVFLVTPVLLMAVGVFLIIKAAQFWLVVISPSEVTPSPVIWNGTSPIEATVFLPNSIRPKDSPVKIDVDILRITWAGLLTKGG